MPCLVTKCSAVQKISSGITITDILNLRCDLDLERSNPIFPQDTPAYSAVQLNPVWLQTDKQFRKYSRNSPILIIKSPRCDLDIEDSEPVFLYDTLAHDAPQTYQGW